MVHMEHMGFPGARSCWYLELWDLQIPGVSLDFHLLRSRLPNALADKRWRLADGQPQGGRRRVATYLWLLLPTSGGEAKGPAAAGYAARAAAARNAPSPPQEITRKERERERDWENHRV
jgi:hypothetical protein